MKRLTIPSVLVFLAACNACSEVPADSDDRYDEDNPASQARLPRGQLECDIDGSTPDSTILLGASTGNPVAIFSCTARGEDVVLKRVQFNNCLTAFPDDDADCADPGEVPGSDAAVSTVSLTYLDVNGVAVTKTGTLASGKVVFNQMNAYFTQDVTKRIAVRVDTNVVDGTIVPSGEQVQMNWNTLPGLATFRAVGVTSGLRVRRPEQYFLPDPFVVRKTKPTVSLSSASPSGVAIPGFSEVFRFNISADARGDLPFHVVIFKITTTDNDNTGWANCEVTGLGEITQNGAGEPTQWKIYDIDDPSTSVQAPHGWNFYDSSLTTCATGNPIAYAAFTLDAQTIPAGQTHTYALKIDTSGASAASDDTIRIDLPDQAEMDRISGIAGGFTPIQWDDGALPPTVFYIDSRLVNNLPVIGGTLVYGSNP